MPTQTTEKLGAPSAAALTQLRLRYELATAAADRYATAGFTTVLQDNFIGAMLTETLQMIRTRPLALVVLAPSAEEVARREQQREKTGYGSFTPHGLDRILRRETPRLGLWVDSTSLTPEETVDEILRKSEDALIR